MFNAITARNHGGEPARCWRRDLSVKQLLLSLLLLLRFSLMVKQ